MEDINLEDANLEEWNKVPQVDCQQIKATYCKDGQKVTRILKIDFSEIIEGMFITQMPIIETLWMLALREARQVQDLYDYSLLLGLELQDTDELEILQEDHDNG